MTHKNVLRWMDGRGWLVFSGGQSVTTIRAQVIERLATDGAVAYITLGDESGLGEHALTDMADLGAPSGYLVNILAEDDETIQSRLADAGMVVIEDSSDVMQMRSALMGAALDGIQVAFENGAIILAEASSAALFGSWLVDSTGNTLTGLEWLEGALIVPGVNAISESPSAKHLLRVQPDAIAVGIGGQSALALGPDGEVELWGERQVSVALGRAYQA